MFQYAATIALNLEEIKRDPQRISKLKPFMNKYNWEGINHPSEKDDWKNIDKNNLTIALNVLYANNKKIYPAYVSKQNSSYETQIFRLMVPNGEGWHYFTIRKLST